MGIEGRGLFPPCSDVLLCLSSSPALVEFALAQSGCCGFQCRNSPRGHGGKSGRNDVEVEYEEKGSFDDDFGSERVQVAVNMFKSA